MTGGSVQKMRLIVVPMKDPAASKTRLNTALTARQRQSFAQLLLRRTLTFLDGLKSRGHFDLAVVTDSDDASKIARQMDVTVIAEGPCTGLNAAVDTAADWAEQRGYGSLCILPADLAAPDPDDVLKLLDRADRGGQAVICPSTDLGTNALLVSPPKAMNFCFGPRSANRHLEAAEAAGLAPVLMPLESLKYDIDTSDNLARALRVAPDLKASLGTL